MTVTSFIEKREKGKERKKFGWELGRSFFCLFVQPHWNSRDCLLWWNIHKSILACIFATWISLWMHLDCFSILYSNRVPFFFYLDSRQNIILSHLHIFLYICSKRKRSTEYQFPSFLKKRRRRRRRTIENKLKELILTYLGKNTKIEDSTVIHIVDILSTNNLIPGARSKARKRKDETPLVERERKREQVLP